MADKDDSNWGPLLGIGLQVLIGIGLGVVVGQWVDKKLHSGPWGLIIGVALGCAAGMYLLIKDVSRINRS